MRESVPAWLLTVAVVGVILLPIVSVFEGAFVVSGLGEATRYGLENWQHAWSDSRVTGALANTVAITVVRLVLGLAIALPTAWFLARTNIAGVRWLEMGIWLSFFLPQLAVVQGWMFLLERQVGFLNQKISEWFAVASPLDVQSFWGIVWVHLMAGSITGPVILFTLAFRNIDGALEEAALVSGNSLAGTFRSVTFPLIRPVFALLTVLALVRGLQSFEIERLLGTPAHITVYGTLVVDLINFEPPRTGEALAFSSTILGILTPLIVLQRLWVGNRQYGTVTGRVRTSRRDLGAARPFISAAVATLVLLITLVPLVSLVVGSFMTRWGFFNLRETWTLNHWRTVFGAADFTRALVTTLGLGVLAAVLAMVCCYTVAYALVRVRFGGRWLLDFVSWLPWTIPGVLLSLGLLEVVLGIPLLRGLHGSPLVLAVAIVLLGFPLGVQLLRGGVTQLGREIEEASAVCGARWWYTQWHVVRPLLSPMLLTVGLITFIAASNEVSAVVLLADVNTRTLSLLSLSYLASLSTQKGAASVVILVITALSMGIALLARALGLQLGVEATAGARTAAPAEPA